MADLNNRKIILSALVTVALGVIFLLPGFISEPLVVARQEVASTGSAVSSQSTDAPVPSRIAEKKQFREKSQRVLAALFSIKERLVDLNVEKWGEPAYTSVLQAIERGDELYSKGEYQLSLQSYEQAKIDLSNLEVKSKTLLNNALAEAGEAIESLNIPAAATHLELLNYLSPGAPSVVVLNRRFKVLPDVAALVEQAEQDVIGDNFVAAETSLATAIALDADHQRATQLLKEVRNRLKKQRFNSAMGNGYAAMDRDEYTHARRFFDEAENVDPGNREVVQALSQLDNRTTSNQVEDKLATARRFEAAEDWLQAVAIYNELIALDSSLTEPRARIVSARIRGELDRQLQLYIENPLSLARSDVYGRARKVLEDASGISRPGEKLRAQIQTLGSLLDKSTISVGVKFESDSLTQVTLYRVGQLGVFESQVVSLKPGRYIAAGSRKGFRDVRVEFSVVPGEQLSPIVIRCTETI